MKVYSTSPQSWQDLQRKVADFLAELGYDTEIEKNIQTVRETINIDVVAINTIDIPQSKILCECKHWSNPVPKTVVHAFRTVVADFGANYGIIISKAGFQSGSHEAVKNTNILLLDWDTFQEYFKVKWIKNKQFAVSMKTRPLYDYVSAGFYVFFKEQYNLLSQFNLQIFENLNREYFHFAFNSSNLDYKDHYTNDFNLELFEALVQETERLFNQNFVSCDEYYNFLVENSEEGIRKFDELFKQNLRLEKRI